jgi:RimJ/RimL family protein N-acetyltransferase
MCIHVYSLHLHLAAESIPPPHDVSTGKKERYDESTPSETIHRRDTALRRASAMSVAAQIPSKPGQPVGIQGVSGDVEQVVVLRNGASVRLRPIRPDDAPRLMALCHRLSPRTVFQRFFSPRRLRVEDAHALANVDYRERMAIVAEVETGQEPALIGVARYGPAEEAAMADIGLVVEDGWQGLGLGSILLTELLQAGAQSGVRHFRADVLTENYRTLRLLARDTHITQGTTSAGVTSITFHRRQNSAAGE